VQPIWNIGDQAGARLTEQPFTVWRRRKLDGAFRSVFPRSAMGALKSQMRKNKIRPIAGFSAAFSARAPRVSRYCGVKEAARRALRVNAIYKYAQA
jgi:hypothetical protein